MIFKSDIFRLLACNIIFIGSCSNIEDLKYVCSDDKNCLTVYEFQDNNSNYTGFIYGRFSEDSLPKPQLHVKNKWRDGWECLIEWKNDTAIIYQPYGLIQRTEFNEQRLKVVQIVDTVFYKLYFESTQIQFTKLSMDDD